MSPRLQHGVLIALGTALVLALGLVEWRELQAQRERAGLLPRVVTASARSEPCVRCHLDQGLGVVDGWRSSRHADVGVGCVECHEAASGRVDRYEHYGEKLVTAVTPRDCGRCHPSEAAEFARSAHARAADVAQSAQAALATVVEGLPGLPATAPCQSCHGSTVTVLTVGSEALGLDELRPDADGRPTAALERVAEVARDADGFPVRGAGWPNGGIGRRNPDGSLGACAACHGRHDVSARRARRPEACIGCHTGTDQPERELFESSRHGVAYRELGLRAVTTAPAGRRDDPTLGPLADGTTPTWVLGRDHAAAPTCATCHFSGYVRGGGAITHDPTGRLSWAHRRTLSVRRDTDADGRLVLDATAARRAEVTDSWQDKRKRMRDVCLACHAASTVDGANAQYDAFVELYARKFAEPAELLVAELRASELVTATPFDEPVEWTAFELWHGAGRRACLGSAMTSPSEAQRGMGEAARLFYGRLLPEARAIATAASGRGADTHAVEALLATILERPGHGWAGNPPPL